MTSATRHLCGHRRFLTLGAVLLVLATSACGSSSGAGSAATSSGSGSATPAAAAATAAPLTVSDAWVKAQSSGMTAAFATLTNTTSAAETVTAANTPVSTMVQLHEVVTINGVSQMRPKPGGFTVPSHGTHTLAPGGDHIMLMNVTTPIVAGDTIPITLTLSDGSTVTFNAVAKDYSGANEMYKPSAGSSGMPGMTSPPTASNSGATMTP